MRSERLGLTSSCDLAGRWGIDPALAAMLFRLEAWADETLSTRWARWPGIYIISGARSEPMAPALSPDAPAATQSRHLLCPALAADLRVGNAPASVTPPTVWAALGSRWEALGGRWGGRFDPPDWNHFDVDPILVIDLLGEGSLVRRG